MTDSPRPAFPGKQLALAVPTSLTMAAVGAVLGSLSSDIGALVGMGAGAAAGSALSSVANDLASWFWSVAFHHGSRWVKPHRVKRPVVVTVAAAAVCFVAALAVVTGGEAATGRTLHASLTGSRQQGTTLGTVLANHPASASPGLSTPTVAPSVTVSPSPTSSRAQVSVSPTPSLPIPSAPAQVPSTVPSGPAVTPSQQEPATTTGATP